MLRLCNRRWLRYSIRTLLVAVTISCIWLGWQASIMHKRRALMAEIIAVGGRVYERPLTYRGYANYWPAPSGDLLALRCCFGDRAVKIIVLPRAQFEEADYERVQGEFAESTVLFDDEAASIEHRFGPNSVREDC